MAPAPRTCAEHRVAPRARASEGAACRAAGAEILTDRPAERPPRGVVVPSAPQRAYGGGVQRAVRCVFGTLATH